MTGADSDPGFTMGDTGFTPIAIEEIFQHNAAWLRDAILHRLRLQPADADDIVQDTYLRAARLPAAEIAHPRAFLAQIALNLFRDRHRREAVRSAHRRDAIVAQSVVAPRLDAIAEQEIDLLLERLILDLPERYREAFVLQRFGGMSIAAIAERLGISPKTVEWRIGKAVELCAIALGS